MKRFNLRSSAFLSGLVFLFIGANVQADQELTTTTTTESPSGVVKQITKTTRIVTPEPTAKETVATPEGYVTCFTVAEGWFDNVWVPAHKVCQYQNSAQGVAWVEGYWGCNESNSDGVCTNWVWTAGHWQKSMVVY